MEFEIEDELPIGLDCEYRYSCASKLLSNFIIEIRMLSDQCIKIFLNTQGLLRRSFFIKLMVSQFS